MQCDIQAVNVKLCNGSMPEKVHCENYEQTLDNTYFVACNLLPTLEMFCGCAVMAKHVMPKMIALHTPSFIDSCCSFAMAAGHHVFPISNALAINQKLTCRCRNGCLQMPLLSTAAAGNCGLFSRSVCHCNFEYAGTKLPVVETIAHTHLLLSVLTQADQKNFHLLTAWLQVLAMLLAELAFAMCRLNSGELGIL